MLLPDWQDGLSAFLTERAQTTGMRDRSSPAVRASSARTSSATFLDEHPDDSVVVLDKLTYAGRMESLQDLMTYERMEFVQGDICDPVAVRDGARELRRDRELRRRVPCRPLDRGAGSLHPDGCLRHLRAARGSPARGRRALSPGFDGRGLRLDSEEGPLRSRARSTPPRPTRPRRRAATSSSAPTATPSASTPSSAAPPTTTARTSTRRS